MSQQKLLRIRQVIDATGIPRSSLYDKLRRGQFPQPVRIGRRAVAWRESDIVSWIESLPAARAEADEARG
jgi:prophage regulatory protein